MVAELVDPSVIAREATTRSVSEIACYLQETLGQQVVAYVCGLKDPEMVGQWASGKSEPCSIAALRLRQAYEAVRLVAAACGPGTARAWLFGRNTRLDDEAPAYLLRYARTFDSMRLIVPAARAFVAGGF